MIQINLDVELAKRKMKSGELAERVGITNANLSILKTGRKHNVTDAIAVNWVVNLVI